MEDLIALAELEEESEEFRRMFLKTEKELGKAEQRTFLGGRYDRRNCILTITAGAGGQDAQDWATMLLHMYTRYAERQGWKVLVLDQSLQVSLEVQGSFVYGLLKRESGVHRLVRMSPFSAKALRHTSFASVEVIPVFKGTEEKDIELRPEDLRVDTFRASGPGGQYVNKRESAVRVTHIPTGIMASSQIQRSQQQNREKAMEMVRARLFQAKEREQEKELAGIRGKQQAIEWGSQIRSYVLHPYRMVKDHRTQVETSDTEGVLDGDLEAFVQEELKL